MMTQAEKQSYLGVRCLSCRQPIPVPAILVGSISTVERENSLLPHEEHDRVFSLRCRSCEREKPYRASDVVEFEGAPVARISRARAHRSSGRSGPISRSANA
jgi:hypothetical protein